MNRLTVLLVNFFLLSSVLFSQGIPELLNYQGVLKDASGNIVPDGNYDLTFNIYDVESGGTAIWSEVNTVNVIDGIVSLKLGTFSSLPPTMFNKALWIGITVGTGSELTPRVFLSTVPYSFYTMNVLDGSITASKIANGEVVKSLNGLKDNVNIVAGSNVTITPSGNDITISSTGGSGGIGGTGTSGFLPVFTGTSSIDNSILFQSGSKIGLGTTTPDYSLTINSNSTSGLALKLSRNGGFGMAFLEEGQPVGSKGWNFDVYQQKFKFNTTADNGFSKILNLMTFDRNGNVGIGIENPIYPLHVATNRKYAGYFTTDTSSFEGHAIHGEYLSTSNSDGIGVYGKSVPGDYYGIGGYFIGGYEGVFGVVDAAGNGEYYGVYGSVAGGTGFNYGVYGRAQYGTYTYGVYGIALSGTNNYAGYFSGNVNVTGTLSKGGGSFKIDHPLDPTNKYLYHSFVESPDMMNIYNGNVVTDASGYVTVSMPDWFEALNKEFRYQLTVIGDFAQAIISQELQNNEFVIRTDKRNVKVSWQITGIRHDKFAEKYRIPVEENKTGKEVGKYIHPDAYGVSETLGVDYENNKIDRKKK